jgi:alpha-beta hydrolase superfamily lysophospholipase
MFSYFLHKCFGRKLRGSPPEDAASLDRRADILLAAGRVDEAERLSHIAEALRAAVAP